MSPGPAWALASRALALLAVDPAGLGGIWLRARPSPARDLLTGVLPALGLPLRRLHPGIADEQLFGGVDLAGTLAAGRVVRMEGLLASPSLLVLPMAERATAGLAARLALTLDERAGHCLVAIDEADQQGEGLPHALADRLAFRLDLDGLGMADCAEIDLDTNALATARGRRAVVSVPGEALGDLARLSCRLGIDGMRAPLLALRAARAHAALEGRPDVGPDDLRAAAELVLAPRATVLPEPEDAEPPAPEPEQAPEAAEQQNDGSAQEIPAEMLLEAVRAVLPPDLLGRMAAGRISRNARGSGEGERQQGNRRGRPLPSRAGAADGRKRIDLVGTLRAAAPWQPMRRAAAPDRAGILVEPRDIRLKRFEDKSDRLLIFVVDASGSAALARLGEAKGAVELLLAEAYARRDHVALIAFRGQGADTLLPPTRSLVQTKRRLAALPGGGGTPLAAGLKAALDLGDIARGRGMTPTALLLTDGRANIALDGAADRRRAADDALIIAGALRRRGMPGLVLDMGNRPERALETLAATLNAPYIPLPRADARQLSATVSAALEV